MSQLPLSLFRVHFALSIGLPSAPAAFSDTSCISFEVIVAHPENARDAKASTIARNEFMI